MPYVLAIPVVSAVFNYLFSSTAGATRACATSASASPQQDWLGDPKTALIVIGAVVVWKEPGFGVILFLARLASAPDDLYEAAKVDGAGFWATMRSVHGAAPRPDGVLRVVELINMLSGCLPTST